jgi:hypothetical protein
MRLLASFFLPCTFLSAPEVVLGHQTLRRRQRICKAVSLRVLLPSVSPPFKNQEQFSAARFPLLAVCRSQKHSNGSMVVVAANS